MAGKARVHELARELGVTSQEVLARLKQLGEFAKSAASTVEGPTARRLRESYSRQTVPASPRPDTAEATPAGSFSGKRPAPPPGGPNPRGAVVPVRVRGQQPWPPRPRREWYRGDDPEGLTKFILDEEIVPRRNPDDQPPGRAYWESEVRQARQLTKEWAPALWLGLDFPAILEWVQAGFPVVEHLERLLEAKVRPYELDWNWEDRGEQSLGVRLSLGMWSIESLGMWSIDMVLNEIERRRALK